MKDCYYILVVPHEQGWADSSVFHCYRMVTGIKLIQDLIRMLSSPTAVRSLNYMATFSPELFSLSGLKIFPKTFMVLLFC